MIMIGRGGRQLVCCRARQASGRAGGRAGGGAQLEDIDEGTYAVLGAASFLAGATRMTVSICVILLELTNNLALLPLVMLVLLFAKFTGDSFN